MCNRELNGSMPDEFGNPKLCDEPLSFGLADGVGVFCGKL
jgi:hypothetical protein